MAWQSAQTIPQIKWSTICNGLHIDGTPHQLFSSLLFKYPTILNVVKHGKRVKQSKTTYLVKFKWGRKQRTIILENPHMHKIPHPAYHTMFVCWLFTMLCASFRCCFFGLVPVTSRLWGPVRLRPFVFLMDSFFFLVGFQARWSYPRNHFYLCLLVARSFAMPMLRYLPLAYHASYIVEPRL